MYIKYDISAQPVFVPMCKYHQQVLRRKLRHEKSFYFHRHLSVARAVGWLSAHTQVCSRQAGASLSPPTLVNTERKKKRCTVIMHSFDLYCTALHSCVCIVQIILCILVHCALRLTMANYSHCREHRCSFPGGKTMGGKPQCSFPANRRHTTAWPRGRFTENMPKSKPKCLHG